MDQSVYKYERLSSENIHHLITLFKIVFKKDVSLDFIIKKYDTSFTGKSFLGHIAFLNNDPIAYGGYIPYKFQYNNSIEIGAQSVDSMAIKEVNGKGIFTHIYNLNEQLLLSDGIHFAYGFANQFSEPVFIHKFGWNSQDRMLAFIIHVPTIPIAKIRNKLGINSVSNRKQDSLGIRLDQFMNPYNSKDQGYGVYDSAFFKYKSFNESRIVKLNNIEVWLKTGRILSVGNIGNCTQEEFAGLIDELKYHAKKMGCNEILFQFSPSTFQAEYLEQITKPIAAGAICFNNFTSKIPLQNILFANSDIDTF